jgi:nucleoid DNA-binding protein
MTSNSGKLPLTLAHAETVKFMCEKTKLSKRTISLVIEIFIFLIKKILIEQGKLHVWSLGTFNLKISRKKDRIKRYAIFFCACDDFKEIMKGQKKLVFLNICSKLLNEKFVDVCSMLGVKMNDLRYLFCLWTYCIIKNLLKYNEYKFLKFGYLKIVNVESVKKSGISKKFPNCKINTRRAIFLFSVTGKRDINRRNKTIAVCRRLKRMMYFSKIDRTIKPKPYLLKNNDAPLATPMTYRKYN